MKEILVIVPCGMAKIWKKNPLQGPIVAEKAYIGAPFKVNREFAKKFGDVWVILSAKYGFILPNFIIPETYEVTFNKLSTNPIDYNTLVEQVQTQGLNEFKRGIGLGGKKYRQAIKAAFRDTKVKLEFPTEGLPIGEAMSFIKQYNPKSSKKFQRLKK